MFVDIEEAPILVIARATASFRFRDLELPARYRIFDARHSVTLLLVNNNDDALTMKTMPVLDVDVFRVALDEDQDPLLMRAY